MHLSTWKELLTPAGQEAMQAARAFEPREADFLTHFQSLSRRFPPEMACAALEIAILRGEATSKFPFAERMYFTRQAMEQASSWEVSTYRAGRLRGFEILADLGCSVGSDSLALADVASTIGIDLDPLRLAMAQANASSLGLHEHVDFLRADLTASLPLAHIPYSIALFFDPARRSNGRRAFSVRHYQPPLSAVWDWLPDFPSICAKISPGVNLDELEEYDAEVEFISLKGELKEAVLWFGPLKTVSRRATLLPGPHTLISPLDIQLSISEPRAYIYEPDPAVLRAGLVRTLGAQIDATQLDADIAYLTADNLMSTPFARAWAVEDWFPFGLKRLRAYLRERGIGRVTVKKRGSPLQPEKLIRDLRLSGEAERVIFLTHLCGRPIVVIGHTLPG